MSKVDVVIPNYSSDNSKIDMLEQCLKSLEENTTVDYSVIVTDDASPTKLRPKLQELAKKYRFKLLLKDENKGFAGNSNDGLKIAKAPYVLLLNIDIIAHKGFLESMVVAMNQPKVGMVSAKLLYPDGKIQYGGTIRNPSDPKWFDHAYRFKPADYEDANKPRELIAFTGACVLFKQEVFKEIGYLDEGFPMAFEDIDFSFRAREVGFTIQYEPRAVCTHLEGATRGKGGRSAREIKSLNYFHKKWSEDKISWFSKPRPKQGGRKTIFGEPIIYIVEATTISGGVRAIFEHVKKLYERGYDVHIWSLQGQPNWFELPIRVRNFPDYPTLEHSLRQIEGVKVATWWKTAPIVSRASREKGTPWYFVQDIETSYYPTDQSMQRQVMNTYTLKEMNYLSTSKWVTNELQKLGVKAHQVGIGIDEQMFFPNPNISRRPNSILLIARSQYLKNWDFVVKVMDRLRQENPSIYVRMFGVEPGLTIPASFDFFYLPKDSQIADMYRSSALFLQLSRHEGFCLPILEAMACGAPVITTNADGNMEFCKNQKNCLVVSKTDVEEAAQTILQLLKDESLANRLSAEGIKTAKLYGWDKSIDKLIKAFESVRRN